MSENVIQIPIQRMETLAFDDAFCSMKERFVSEMKRVEEAIDKFSTSVFQKRTTDGSNTSAQDPHGIEVLADCPLVEGEGEDRTLKLQFDVSNFQPNEVQVSLKKNKIIISATHEEKTDNSSTLRQYHREFYFPVPVKPEDVTSCISKDGVLFVKAPVPA